jgi:hypothetical protein
VRGSIRRSLLSARLPRFPHPAQRREVVRDKQLCANLSIRLDSRDGLHLAVSWAEQARSGCVWAWPRVVSRRKRKQADSFMGVTESGFRAGRYSRPNAKSIRCLLGANGKVRMLRVEPRYRIQIHSKWMDVYGYVCLGRNCDDTARMREFGVIRSHFGHIRLFGYHGFNIAIKIHHYKFQ